jgi:hypothetical protein
MKNVGWSQRIRTYRPSDLFSALTRLLGHGTPLVRPLLNSIRYCDVLPSKASVISRITCLSLCLFGLSLAELQLFTSQLITYKPVTCLLVHNCGLLVVGWRELNCSELVSYWLVLNWTGTGFNWNSLYNLRANHTQKIPSLLLKRV